MSNHSALQTYEVEEQNFWDTRYNVFGIKQTLCQNSKIIKFIIRIG